MEIVLSVFFLYAAYRHFLWLLFPMDNSWVTLTANNFGDLPLHINFIRAFANGIPFPPKNPIFSADLLRYPYGIDLYNALLEQVGFRLQSHLLLVGGFATVASLIFLRAFAGWLGIGAFFLSGGLAGWEVLNGAPLRDFQNGVDWKNLFLSVFITQRGMLIAIPLGLCLVLAVRGHFSGERRLDKKEMTSFGFAWGFLPLFHLHAFVAVSLFMGAAAFEFQSWPGLVRLLRSRLACMAYVPALFFILFSTHFLSSLHSSAFIRFAPGWTMKEGGGHWKWAVENFGAWLLVPPVLGLMLLSPRGNFARDEKRRLWIEFGTYTFLFVFFFNVMFAPWEWDNIKLLVWPYLGFARLIWILFDRRMGSALGFFERPLLALILFLSGLVTITWTLLTPLGRAVPVYEIGDLANTEGALAGIPATAVFAAAPSHNHQITFWGRMRVAGYQGHLWSHGIDSKSVNDKVERIMRDDPEAVALAKELGITHIFWGPQERAQYGVEKRAWMKTLANISRVPGYEVYAVN